MGIQEVDEEECVYKFEVHMAMGNIKEMSGEGSLRNLQTVFLWFWHLPTVSLIQTKWIEALEEGTAFPPMLLNRVPFASLMKTLVSARTFAG